MSDKEDKTEPKLSDTQQAIIQVAEVHPNLNNNQIAKKLIATGQIKGRDAVYKALQKSDYTRLKLEELRSRITEDHARVMFPLAQKRLKQVLKDKDATHRDAMTAVKLVYDKQMGDKEEPTQVTQVNIEEMRQVIIDGTRRGEE